MQPKLLIRLSNSKHFFLAASWIEEPLTSKFDAVTAEGLVFRSLIFDFSQTDSSDHQSLIWVISNDLKSFEVRLLGEFTQEAETKKEKLFFKNNGSVAIHWIIQLYGRLRTQIHVNHRQQSTFVPIAGCNTITTVIVCWEWLSNFSASLMNLYLL